MNVGLGNLAALKAHLQGIALATETRFDQIVQDVGLGVAAQMENFCDRKFARAAADQFIAQADRASFVLPRYPIETITKVEFKANDTDGWQSTGADIPVIETTSPLSGLVYLQDDIDAGRFYNQIRITYTGGYFFETLESTDPGYPTAQPAGSTALPQDLRLAWLVQCRRVWSALDKLGTKIVDNSAAAQAALQTLDWTPEAKQLLEHYRRMQLV